VFPDAKSRLDPFLTPFNVEVDFVTANGNQVIPIEVKSGKSGTLKSLQQFALNKNAAICVRFALSITDST